MKPRVIRGVLFTLCCSTSACCTWPTKAMSEGGVVPIICHRETGEAEEEGRPQGLAWLYLERDLSLPLEL